MYIIVNHRKTYRKTNIRYAAQFHCSLISHLTVFQESPIFQLQVTFAALQEGNKSAFNPTKLVESLQLRTSEQQDAQEWVLTEPIEPSFIYKSRFSKLFMSHLDAEFKKQSLTSVKSLITDQVRAYHSVNVHSHITITSSKAPKFMAPSVMHVDLVPKGFQTS